MKATKVAICEFLARHPSTVTDPRSMMLEADSTRAYSIASKRHLLAMRSELGATIRDLKQKISLGYWPRSAYERLVAELKSSGLIDISGWDDADGARIRRVLEAGEIRTAADFRRVTEYRDTISDPELLDKLDALVANYESNVPRGGSPSQRAPVSTRQVPKSKLSPEQLQLLDILRRSAIASLEYAAQHGDKSVRGASALPDRANTWRTLKVETPRELRDLERAFWEVLSNLQGRRLSEEAFQGLTASLKNQGLIDISKLNRMRRSQRYRKGTG